MTQTVEDLARSLLYEGYALYPYTPGATKNATPTPFGIVYPPAYAGRSSTTFDHLQIECILEYRPESSGASVASVEGVVLFLRPSGVEHRATEQRITLERTAVEVLPGAPVTASFSFEGEAGEGSAPVTGRAGLTAEILSPGVVRVTLRVDNQTEIPPESAQTLDRPKALLHSFISTHVYMKAAGGKFVSPLESKDPRVGACRNINSWPVLATAQDDAVLGASIMLPEHPQIAPESKVNFFDNTEIEEALVLHAQTLSDDQLEDLKQQDPAVQEMIACARQVSPEELLKMHGRLNMKEKGEGILSGPTKPRAPEPRFRGSHQAAPPSPPPDLMGFPDFQTVPPEYRGHVPAIPQGRTVPPADPIPVYEGLTPIPGGAFTSSHQATPPAPPMGYEDVPGLQEIDVDGRHLVRGGKVLLKLLRSGRQDAIDHLLDGRTATIERILKDYDGRIHIGVTMDGDPGQELLRETNRFMYFFVDEVEVISS